MTVNYTDNLQHGDSAIYQPTLCKHTSTTDWMAGGPASVVSKEKRDCITGVKFLIRSPAEHHLRGFPSLAVKQIWTCVGLPFMEQEAVGSAFPQHASAQQKGVRGCATLATLEMKTHGENNKLICSMKRTFFFSFQLKVPEWPPCYELKKKRPWTPPHPPLLQRG